MKITKRIDEVSRSTFLSSKRAFCSTISLKLNENESGIIREYSPLFGKLSDHIEITDTLAGILKSAKLNGIFGPSPLDFSDGISVDFPTIQFAHRYEAAVSEMIAEFNNQIQGTFLLASLLGEERTEEL